MKFHRKVAGLVPMRKLNAQQEKFVQLMGTGLDPRSAASAAGYKGKNASYDLLAKPHVVAAIRTAALKDAEVGSAEWLKKRVIEAIVRPVKQQEADLLGLYARILWREQGPDAAESRDLLAMMREQRSQSLPERVERARAATAIYPSADPDDAAISQAERRAGTPCPGDRETVGPPAGGGPMYPLSQNMISHATAEPVTPGKNTEISPNATPEPATPAATPTPQVQERMETCPVHGAFAMRWTRVPNSRPARWFLSNACEKCEQAQQDDWRWLRSLAPGGWG